MLAGDSDRRLQVLFFIQRISQEVKAMNFDSVIICSSQISSAILSSFP
nr:MAG TPA: hypothetical protein [Caudoviricetes sp.]